jgi:WD40 repeat protein
LSGGSEPHGLNEGTPAVVRAEGERSISVGRDAFGNVFVTGEGNDVRVTLVVADQRLLARLRAPATATEPIDNPYRGLDAFYETDAPLFFGRRKLARRAWVLFQKLQRGAGPRILAVIGASGSGKSSLVRAGLLPELAREPMAGLESPKVLVLRPGPAPFGRLAEVLSRLPGAEGATESSLREDGRFDTLHRLLAHLQEGDLSRFVIVVDQFEELFTECSDTATRTAFLENLSFAASAADGLVSVILTLRGDFAGAVTAPPAFASAVRESPLRVQAMDRDELSEAIARPAHELGRPWPQALVENLVTQAEGRTGALPLLQFALKRLWPDHVAGRLDESSWSSHLIEDFLVEAADILFETTGTTAAERATNQRLVRRAFLAMTQLGEGTADARRIAPLSDFVAHREDALRIRNVLAPFTAPEARLIAASEQEGEPTYELTHEALISSWDRLRAWLGNVPDKTESERIRTDLRLHRRLSAVAAEWKAASPRDKDGYLLRNPQLVNALDIASRWSDELTSELREFISLSDSAARSAARRRRRIVRAIAAIGVVLGGLAGIGAIGAYVQRQQALVQQSRYLADLARQSADQGHVDSAMLLALEGLPVTRGALVPREWVREPESQLRRSLYANRELKRLSNVSSFECINGQKPCHPLDAAIHPSNALIASRFADGTIRVWNPESEEEVRRLHPSDGKVLDHVIFSPDGKRLLEFGYHKIRVWDIEADVLLAEQAFDREIHPYYSAHGAYILVLDQDGVRKFFDSRLKPFPWLEPSEQVPSVNAISFNEDRVVTFTGDTVQTRNIITGAEVLVSKGLQDLRAQDAAFSPDGALFGVIYDNRATKSALVRIYDARSGDMLAELEDVAGVAFSPDSARIVVAFDHAPARAFDARSGSALVELENSKGAYVEYRHGLFNQLAFAPNGIQVIMGGRYEPSPYMNRPLGGRFGPGAQRVWDSKTGKELSSYGPRCKGEIQRFSSDGTLLLTKEASNFPNEDRTYLMRVCDAESGGELFRFSGNGGYDRYPWFHEWSEAVGGFARDNRWIITEQTHTDPESDRDTGSDIRLWDAQVTKPLLEFGKQMCPETAYCGTELTVFDTHGVRIATVGRAGIIQIWNALTGKRIAEIDGIKVPVLSLSFSPDGQQIAATSYDWARVWDAGTGAIVHDLVPPGCCSQAVGYSGDGARILLFAGSSISVWDAKSGNPLRTVQLGDLGPVMGVAINHQGTRLFALGHEAYLIDSETGKIISHIPRQDVPADVGEFVRAIGFSRDDSVVFVVGNKAGVAVWNASTGALLAGNVKRTFDSVLIGGAISPSGKFLLTLSMNNSVPGIAQLWDVATGTELGRIEGHLNDIASADFTPDGKRLAIGSASGAARIIPLLPEDSQSLVDLACGHARNGPLLPTRWALPAAYRELPKDSRERFFLGPNAVGPCDRDGLLSWRYWAGLVANTQWTVVKWFQH